MDDAADNRDQRDQPRFRVRDCMIRYSTRTGLLAFLAKPEGKPLPLVNLSTGGMEFLSHEDLGSGQPLKMNLDVPAFDAPLEVRAEVRWCRRVPGRKVFKVGVEFVQAPKDVRQRLEVLQGDDFIRDVQRAGDFL